MTMAVHVSKDNNSYFNNYFP